MCVHGEKDPVVKGKCKSPVTTSKFLLEVFGSTGSLASLTAVGYRGGKERAKGREVSLTSW